MNAASRPLAAILLLPLTLALAALAFPFVIATWAAIDRTSLAAYEQWFLWLVTSYHVREPLLFFAPALAILALAPLGWRRDRRPLHVALCALGLAMLFVATLYIAHPYRLWRVSDWPWLSAFAAAAALYVWLRLNWLYWPLQAVYRWPLRVYLRLDPRAAAYFGLLADLRKGSDAWRGRRYPADTGALAKAIQWVIAQVRAAFTSHRAGVGLLRFFTPQPEAQSLADGDRLLHDVLVHLRKCEWVELERELYGSQAKGAPVLDAALQARLRRRFRRWTAYTDALAECHAAGLIGAKRLDAPRRRHLRDAADLLCEAAARHALATLRAQGNAEFYWSSEDAAARELYRKAIVCLQAAGAAVGPDGVADDGDTLQARLAMCQFAADGPGAAITPKAIDRLRRICGTPQAGLDEAALEDLVQVRLRFLEWAVLSKRFSLVRDLVSSREPNDAARREAWFAAAADLALAKSLADPRGTQTVALLKSSVDWLAFSGHPSLRTMHEVFPLDTAVPADMRGELAAVAFARDANIAMARDAAEPEALRDRPWTELHGHADKWRIPAAPPNVFTRSTLAAASIACLALFAASAVHLRAGAIVDAPDLRFGEQARITQVHRLSHGTERDPSLWVATDAGVHVKAGGTHHHWNRIEREVYPELVSDDVRSVDVGEARVTYVCASGDRRGVSLSDAPRHEPGARPWLALDGWSALLGFSSFADASDAHVSALSQAGDGGIVLVGAREPLGLGRYLASERRWLDQPTLDVAGGFLPQGYGSIHDIAAVEIDGRWQAWVGTDLGLAGGWITPRSQDARDASLAAEDWSRIEPRVGAIVEQVRARRTESGVALDYRTQKGGLGRATIDAQRAVSERTVVGEASLPNLSEATLRRAVYDPAATRIWFHDQPARADGAARSRFLAYDESSHDWHATALDAPFAERAVFDLEPDPGRRAQAIAGLAGGLLLLEDRGDGVHDRIIEHKGRDALAVAAGAGESGAVAYFESTSDQARSLVHLARAAATVDATETAAPLATVIGERRMERLELADIAAVEPDVDQRNLFVGTRKRGVGYIDVGRREVFAPPGAETAVQDVRDLALASPQQLFVVSDGRQLQRLELQSASSGRAITPKAWLLNTSVSAAGKETTVAVLGPRLFCGSERGIASYEFSTHQWTKLEAVERLGRLYASAGRLWAHTRDGALSLLDAEPNAPKWSRTFDGRPVHAVDPARAAMAVITEDGSVRVHDGKEMLDVLLPEGLGDAGSPSCAAVVERVLLLAPLAKAIGRYDLDSHRWSTLPLPVGCEKPKEMRVEGNVLWLLCKSDELFAASGDAKWTKLDWAAPSVSGVASWFAGPRGAIVRHQDGVVATLTVAAGQLQTQSIVGAATKGDPNDASAVVEFKGNWYFAEAGALRRYSPKEHAWTTLQPDFAGSSNTPVAIQRMIATVEHLYVLGSNGALLRLGANAFESLARLFTAGQPNGAAAPRVLAIEGLTGAASNVASALGCATDAGVFAIDDGTPNAAVPLLARSVGPPNSANIDCAASIEYELLLGTQAHGLWGYVYGDDASGDNGAMNPLRWVRLLDGASGAISKVATSSKGAALFAAVTPNAVHVFTRGRQIGPWTRSAEIKGKTLDAAICGNAVHVAFAPRAGTALESSDGGQDAQALIGAQHPRPGSPTKCVAFDGKLAQLLRVDGEQLVARYDLAARSWSNEPIGKGAIRDVFEAAGALWAWSPANHRLDRLDRKQGGAWIEYPLRNGSLAPAQVVWESERLVVRAGERDTEELWLVDDKGARCLLPGAAHANGVLPSEVTAVADVGSWTLFATKKSGVHVYDRAEHSWSVPSKIQVQRWDRQGDALYALCTDASVQWVRAGPAQLLADPVNLANEKARTIFHDGQRELALSAGGKLFALENGAAKQLLAPVPLALSVKQVRAACEHDGRLYLACTTDGNDVLAAYDPTKLAWNSFDSGGHVLRFVRLAKAKQLLAVVRPRQRQDLFVLDVKTEQPVATGLRDVASDGERVWWIDANQDLVAMDSPKAPLGGTTRLAEKILQALAIEHEVVAWLADGSLWRYSVAAGWKKDFDPKTVGALVDVGGTPFAIGRTTPPEIHGYKSNGRTRAWTRIDGLRLSPDPETPATWEVTNDKNGPSFRWRPDVQATFAPVAWQDGRFEFDRLEQVQWEGAGLLATSAHKTAAQDVAAWRWQPGAITGRGTHAMLAAARAPAALAEADPVPFAGERFHAAVSQNAAWQAVGTDGKAFQFEVRLVLDDGAGTQVAVAPQVIAGATWLNVDHWLDLGAANGELVAQTPAGLLSVKLANSSVQRLMLAANAAQFEGFCKHDGRLVASFSNAPPWAYDPRKRAWAPDPTLKDAWVVWNSPLRDRALVKAFELEADAKTGIALALLQGGKSLPVTLSESGFAFDRPQALGLSNGTVELYTLDGRVRMAKGAPQTFELDQETPRASRAMALHKAVRVANALYCLEDDAKQPGGGFELANGAWAPIAALQAQAIAQRDPETWNGGGWNWRRDDEVDLELAGTKMTARYDAAAGRFDFDKPLAIAAQDDDVWLATRAGVQRWRNGKMAAIQPIPAAREAARAEFVRVQNGGWVLELGESPKAALFQLANGVWAPAANAQGAVEDARSYLLRDARWRGQRAKPRRFELHPTGNEVELVNGAWDFEASRCVAGSRDRVCVGSSAGLLALDRGNVERRFTRTDGAVERVAVDGASFHVKTRDAQDQPVEALFDKQLGRDGKPAKLFEEKDRQLIDGARLRFEKLPVPAGAQRQSGVHIEVRPSAGGQWATVEISGGRFDFDTVHAVGLGIDDAPLLATESDAGIIARGGEDVLFAPLAGVPPPPRATDVEFHRVWFDGQLRNLLETAPGVVYEFEKTWKALAAGRAQQATDDADVQVAENGVWSIRRAANDLQCQLIIDDRREPVQYDAKRGAFTFDRANDVLVLPDGRLLLATEGGVCCYELAGRNPAKLVDLRASLVLGAEPDVARALDRTAIGPIVEIATGASTPEFFQLELSAPRQGKAQLKSKAIVAVNARKEIHDFAVRIHEDSNGWTVVERDAGAAASLCDGKFDMWWSSEPVCLVERDGGRRFAHDLPCAVEWHASSLWVATEGGVLRFELDATSAELRGANQRPLQSAEFAAEGPRARVAIEAVDVAGARVLILREDGETWQWNDADRRWQRQQRAAPVDVQIVHRSDEWTWRLTEQRQMRIEFDERFQFAPTAHREFVDGTLSHWRLPKPGAWTHAPVVFRSDWYVATAAGVLRLDATTFATERLYGRTSRGAPITGVTDLFIDEEALHARTAAGVFRHDAAADSWSAVESQQRWTRALPIACAWLDLSFPKPGAVQVALAEHATDTPNRRALALIDDRGFRFDRISDFTFAGEHYWGITELGLARVHDPSGRLFLFARGWPADGRKLRAHAAADGIVRVVDAHGGVWEVDETVPALVMAGQTPRWLEEVELRAANALFDARTRLDGTHSIALRAAGFPSADLGASSTLLRAGVFAFDDVRDARMLHDDELVVSTRWGVWTYDPMDAATLAHPRSADYLADLDGVRSPMTDLGAFLRDPARPGELAVYGAQPSAGFQRDPDLGWCAVVLEDAAVNPRPFDGDDGSWTVGAQGATLAATVVRDQRESSREWNGLGPDDDPLGSAFATPTSIWLPLRRGIVWIRKREF